MWWTLWRFLTSSSREEEKIEPDQLRESTKWTRQEMHSCKMSKSANQNKNLDFFGDQRSHATQCSCRVWAYLLCVLEKPRPSLFFPTKNMAQQYGKMTNCVTVHAANIQGRCLKWKSATALIIRLSLISSGRNRNYIEGSTSSPLHFLPTHLIVCGQSEAIFTLTAKKPFSVCGALVSTNHRRATHGVH